MSAAAALAFLLRHEALVGWAAVLAGAALAGALLAHGADAPALSRARAGVATAEQAARASAAQAQVTGQAAAAVQTAQGRESALTRTTETYAHAVQTAPQAAQSLPSDVLRDWSSGIDGLRDEAARARPAAAAPGLAGAAGAVPAPGPPVGP